MKTKRAKLIAALYGLTPSGADDTMRESIAMFTKGC